MAKLRAGELMRNQAVSLLWVGVALCLAAGGCPSGTEFIPGGTGNSSQLGPTPSVDVVSPSTNQQITGGAPIIVNWRAIATTNFSFVSIIFDQDTDPDNGNEFLAQSGIPISDTTATLDTTLLPAGAYRIGVLLTERNELTAFDYSAGALIVNQASQLFFTSPRTNFVLDRTNRIFPKFDVAWQVSDPDSTVVVEIFLDPDATPNGNEIKLRESNNQTGDSFSFDLPVSGFDPGTYRILAVVNDGTQQFSFYAPASIRIRARIAGYHDLRDLALGNTEVEGAVFEGFNPQDNVGSIVSGLRDVDNDGFGDFIINAQFGKPLYQFNLQRAGIGEAYLVYGRQQRFSGAIPVNSIGTLIRGDVFLGVGEVPNPIRPSRGITSIASLADWDQDGIAELAFGIPFVDSASFGTLDPLGYFRTGAVVIASSTVLRPDVAFPGGQAIELGAIGSQELSNDKTAPNCPMGFYGPKSPNPNGTAETYFHRYVGDVIGIVDTRVGCRISSNDFGDQFGESISPYAYDGIIMAAPNRDPFTGTIGAASVEGGGLITAYINATQSPFYPWSFVNPIPPLDTAGYPGPGPNEGVNFIPHDGPFHYIAVESRPLAPFAIPVGYRVDPDNAENPCERIFDPRTPTIGSTIRFWSNVPGGRLSEVSSLQDFDGDGLEDLTIGHPLAANAAGVCYVIFGRLEGLIVGGELQLEELELPLSDGANLLPRLFDGVRIVGEPGTRLGTAQDSAGDFNGDGLTDLVIGSPLLNDRRGGAAIFFGSRDVINLTDQELRLVDLPTRGLGLILQGENPDDLAGARVSGVGDIDGDGLDDIMIAAPNKSVQLDIDLDGVIEIDRTTCGVVYLIYGSATLGGVLNLADVGTERVPGAVFIGRNSGDFLGAGLGEQGDRSFGIGRAGDIDGDGRLDLLMGSVSASPRNRLRAGEAYLIYGEGD